MSTRLGDVGSDVSSVLSTIAPGATLYTNVTPPVDISFQGGGGGGPGGGTDPLLSFLQPTLVVHTAAGDVVVAPAGQANVNSFGTWAAVAGVGLAIFGGIFMMLGYKLAKR